MKDAEKIALVNAHSAEEAARKATWEEQKAKAEEQQAVAAKLTAERRKRESEASEHDLLREILQSRRRSLESNISVSDLADLVMQSASPLRSLVAMKRKADALSFLGDHNGAVEQLTEALSETMEPARAELSRSLSALEETMLTLAEALLRPARGDQD